MLVLLALSLFAMLITIHDDDPDGGSGDNSNGEVNVGGVVVFSSSSARQKIPRRFMSDSMASFLRRCFPSFKDDTARCYGIQFEREENEEKR
ncbi:hypothetical protein M0802_000544 [Mischocyttarus mexicanus]|nr:hypothetical protein M0802_000544 [Mischocyttarus mexicanus]